MSPPTESASVTAAGASCRVAVDNPIEERPPPGIFELPRLVDHPRRSRPGPAGKPRWRKGAGRGLKLTKAARAAWRNCSTDSTGQDASPSADCGRRVSASPTFRGSASAVFGDVYVREGRRQ